MTKYEKFINEIGPIIQAEATSRGYKFPSAIIAQACLESAFGTSQLSAIYHNYFGLKCGTYWHGQSVNMKTREEYHPGHSTIIKDNFRVYRDMEEGVKGYFDFISTQRYASLKNAVSSKDYLEKIKAAGYATSSTYVKNVSAVVTKYGLDKYDGVTTSTDTKVDIDKIARDVIAGKYGNGDVRRQKLGSLYDVVQKRVNEMLK